MTRFRKLLHIFLCLPGSVGCILIPVSMQTTGGKHLILMKCQVPVNRKSDMNRGAAVKNLPAVA